MLLRTFALQKNGPTLTFAKLNAEIARRSGQCDAIRAVRLSQPKAEILLANTEFMHQINHSTDTSANKQLCQMVQDTTCIGATPSLAPSPNSHFLWQVQAAHGTIPDQTHFYALALPFDLKI